VRGFRVEPGEIEATLTQHPGVHAAVVSAAVDASGDVRLIAYVVLDGQAVDEGELRRFVENRLPEYMVPVAFAVLDSLPLTPNGKVDRGALPPPETVLASDRAGYLAPRTPIEEALAGIWAKILRVDRVGVRDNFFALGGHSLLATQVVSRVRTTVGVDLPLSALFEDPTVADLAMRVSTELLASSSKQEPPIVRLPREGTRALESVATPHEGSC
jgi:hypothetical protein